MTGVPITFEYKGKTYAGYFGKVSGEAGDLWHLTINNVYEGQFFYSQYSQDWAFRSNTGKFQELSDFFQFYMISWFA